MLKCLECLGLNESKLSKAALFAGGVLFGTAGLKILGSSDAKKAYVNCIAAGLRAKESVMTTATAIQENAEDILAEAKEINRQRMEVVCEDAYEEEIPEEENETEA